VLAQIDSSAAADSGSARHWLVEYLGNLRRISSEARWFLLGSLLIGMAWSTFMLLLNLYLKERGFLEADIGRVLSSSSLGAALMTFPAVLLAKQMSARTLLVAASFGAAAAWVWQTHAADVVALMASALVVGMMLSFGRVISSPFLMKYSTPAERSHAFSLSFGAMLSAGLIAHLGAGSLHRVLTGVAGSSVAAYRWVLLMACGAAALAMFAYGRIPAAVVVQRSTKRLWRELLPTNWRLLFRLTFPFFLVGSGAGLVIPFLNLYFRDRFDLSTQMIGVYYGLVTTSMLIGVMLGPELARRFGMVRTIVATEIASLPFMVTLAFTYNLPLATVAFLARGALMNLGVPIANNYMMERVDVRDRLLANSWSMMAWALSWALMTGLGGWMIEHWGFELPLLVASGLYAVASTMYWTFFRRQEIYAGKRAVGAPQPVDE
jgi:predicted MFS family arabinose efflux permease